MYCDGETVLMLSLKGAQNLYCLSIRYHMLLCTGLQVKEIYAACSRTSQGRVAVQSNILRTAAVSSFGASFWSKMPGSPSKGGPSHAAVFDGYVQICLKYFMKGKYDSYTGDIELFLLDMLEDGGPEGILGCFKLWQTAPSKLDKRTARLVIIQPSQEIVRVYACACTHAHTRTYRHTHAHTTTCLLECIYARLCTSIACGYACAHASLMLG